MKDEDHGTSTAFASIRGGDGWHLRHRADHVCSGARQGQVRWFVSWDVRWRLCGQPRDGIRRIFRGEWRHYRDRSRSGRGKRGFFRLGDFQRFTRGGGCHLQVYWRLPVVKRRERSRYRFVVLCWVWANRKGHVECRSTVSEFGALYYSRPKVVQGWSSCCATARDSSRRAPTKDAVN